MTLTASTTATSSPISPANAALEKAAKTCRALEPFARGRKLDVRTQAEKETAMRTAYEKEFGRSLCGKQLRDIVARAVQRDGGREDFTRVELWMDEPTGRKANAAPQAVKP